MSSTETAILKVLRRLRKSKYCGPAYDAEDTHVVFDSSVRSAPPVGEFVIVPTDDSRMRLM